MSFATVPVERSSLTYTLLPNTPITWGEFSLIVRSLHNFKVHEIVHNETLSSITVTVNYFANTNNARKRLGAASEFIEVSRESPNVKPDELQALQQLRAKFGFGRNDEDEEQPPSKSNKKRRYATSS